MAKCWTARADSVLGFHRFDRQAIWDDGRKKMRRSNGMNMRIAAALVVSTLILIAGAQATPSVQATLTLGNTSAGIASDPSLAKVFVTNFDSGTVSVIDMNALTVLATIAVGSSPRRIIADAATHRVYVVNDTTPGTVTVINASSNAVAATIPGGNNHKTK